MVLPAQETKVEPRAAEKAQISRTESQKRQQLDSFNTPFTTSNKQTVCVGVNEKDNMSSVI
jgi:hypothetical protein